MENQALLPDHMVPALETPYVQEFFKDKPKELVRFKNEMARWQLSAILHGVWLLVFVTGMATLLRQIPTSCLAAILVYTGYKLIDVKSLRELRGYGWGEVVIYAITVSVIVFEDLLMGPRGIGPFSTQVDLYRFPFADHRRTGGG